MEQEIDISPENGGSKGRKSTVFQESEWDQIMNNNALLTKEGINKKIELWKLSQNKHVVIKYSTMLARCKNIQPSGRTKTGEIILGYAQDGTANWVQKDPDYKPPVVKKKGE